MFACDAYTPSVTVSSPAISRARFSISSSSNVPSPRPVYSGSTNASPSTSEPGCASHTNAYPTTRPVGPLNTHASRSSENRGRPQSSRRSSSVKSGSPKSAMSPATTTSVTGLESRAVGLRTT